MSSTQHGTAQHSMCGRRRNSGSNGNGGGGMAAVCCPRQQAVVGQDIRAVHCQQAAHNDSGIQAAKQPRSSSSRLQVTWVQGDAVNCLMAAVEDGVLLLCVLPLCLLLAASCVSVCMCPHPLQHPAVAPQ